jgi:hypothetical protein
VADLLFNKFDLRLVIEHHGRELRSEVDNIEANRLLNTSVNDRAEYLIQKYLLDAPELVETDIEVDHSETKIDVSQDPMRFVSDRSRPAYVPGTEVMFFVPFTGDPDLLQCRPSTFSVNPPRASIMGSRLVLSYSMTTPNAVSARGQFDHDLASIQKHLDWVRGDVTPFNNDLPGNAEAAIQARRERLLADQGMASALGFPLASRPGSPQTFRAPTVQRKLPSPPSATSQRFKPEPALGMDDYEHILRVAQSMVGVMERSPHAFKDMGEEDLRSQFLVQLNGHYEGQATGETFNYEGKTDILIRVGDRNIFIGECKFWKGQQALTTAIDQLLGYATWRDTKTALFVFNRLKNFSAVVRQIPEVVRAHPNFKRELSYDVETGFRCVLRHRDDPNRELVLTALAFDVPV